MFNQLIKKLEDWCLSKQTIEIGKLYESTGPSPCSIYDPNGKLKFIGQSSPKDLYVETPTGYSKIKSVLKTVKYQGWKVTTKNYYLICADTHIFIDENDNEVFAKDLSVGSKIQTKTGIEAVEHVQQLDDFVDHMYDVELDDDNHVYYTNGMLSHNSTVSSAFLLWFAMFNFDKTVLIASNKNKNAMEMILRIRFAYENLPFWIKPGVLDDGWNKHEIGFDNGSRIVSTATSEDSGRGMSISLLYLDEFAFVPPTIQSEFWTSIAPTLSTGGNAIITSTPNGDSDIFAELWRGANITRPGSNVGINGFYPIYVKWDDPPGRDEKFKETQIAKIGLRRWKQEYECEFLSSDALLIDTLVLQRLTEHVKQKKPIKQVKDVTFWKDIREGGTYLVGVDPSTGSGEDFSVITIYDFPDLEQVAEYRSNTMSTNNLYSILKNLLLFLERKNATIYFSVENNGIGEGIIALYEADERPPELSELVSDDNKAGRQGMTTTSRVKMKACVNLKEMLERGTLNISSPTLLSELKTFARKRGSYAALPGSTDDCVSATLIVVRMIEMIASYDQEAFDKLYSNKDFEQWSDNDFIDFEGEDYGDDGGLPVIF